ncbi:MAG: hypothetical protein MJZ37_00250 [Bacilli bacterium]|nr:hypothetical protein [Bacilli bacterium]
MRYNKNEVLKLCYELCDANIEKIMVICLTENGTPFAHSVIRTGTEQDCTIRVKDIIKYIRKYNCKNFVLCHNHTNGILDQSEEDDHLTSLIIELESDFDYKLVDHIIVMKGNPTVHFSYKDINFKFVADNSVINNEVPTSLHKKILLVANKASVKKEVNKSQSKQVICFVKK